jgi:hypothetical protein
MTVREIEEYRAMRCTIRERGTARLWIFTVGLAAWGALTVATLVLVSLPVATLIPLVVLAGSFEAVLALHIGVERIGRYLQVFFEDESSDPGWEHRIMAFARTPLPGGGAVATDPLFAVVFCLAALFNLIPAALAGAVASEWVIIGGIHAVFVVRVLRARSYAGRQRQVELARFQELKRASGSGLRAPAAPGT